MSAIPSCKSTVKKHDVYRGQDCMRKFCKSLREHAMNTINSKNRKNDVINKRTAGIIWKCKNL